MCRCSVLVNVKMLYCALKEVCHYKAIVARVTLQSICSAITYSIYEERGTEPNYTDDNTILNEST